MVTIPGIGIKVTCKKETKIYTSGAQIPDCFTISLISSFEISVRPNASRIKYPATTIAIIIKPEITSLMMDFFASGLSGLIISLL